MHTGAAEASVVSSEQAAGLNRNETPTPEGVRDTIESIVVAFILAFVFRAFIVEAFVIPTGSMAPSLYGKHGHHRCVVCRLPFAYGIREPVIVFTQQNPPRKNLIPGTLEDASGRPRPFDLICPNCRWQWRGNADLNTGEDPVVDDAGDRILVLKWPYDIGGRRLGPQRWDVVVFKDPKDGETNFIKRLLGLHGEVLQIINGDLFTAPIEKVRQDIIEQLTPRAVDGEPGVLRGGELTEEQLLALADVLTIQRKTEVAQESLWMLHYDHDYVPDISLDWVRAKRSKHEYPYWEGASSRDQAAWNAETPVVRFDPTVDPDQFFQLALKGPPIQDEYGYNNLIQNGNRDTPVNVGDVRLSFTLFPGKLPPNAKGEMVLKLGRGGHRFQARIRDDGRVILEGLRMHPGAEIWDELKQGEIAPLIHREPRVIEFENLDYRVALRVDDEEIFATSDDQYEYRPTIKRLMGSSYEDGRFNNANVAIDAKGRALEIRHLQVHRDVFYRSSNQQFSNSFAGWGVSRRPILLRDDPPDFYCCGDNSPQSQDSRWWTEVCPMLKARGNYQYGTVPGDQLIGRAFFVYWPGGLRFTKETPAVIPNVGRMRIIR